MQLDSQRYYAQVQPRSELYSVLGPHNRWTWPVVRGAHHVGAQLYAIVLVGGQTWTLSGTRQLAVYDCTCLKR